MPTSHQLYKRSPEKGANIAAGLVLLLYLLLLYILFFVPLGKPKRMPAHMGEPTDHLYKYEITIKRYLV